MSGHFGTMQDQVDRLFDFDALEEEISASLGRDDGTLPPKEQMDHQPMEQILKTIELMEQSGPTGTMFKAMTTLTELVDYKAPEPPKELSVRQLR